jgi:putative SOS response-associated peptidase YedK
MCGRYTLRSPAADVARAFQVDATPSLFPRYNIAPTQSVPIVRKAAAREMVLARWGLVPSWASDLSIGYKLINARSETAASKPSFRSAFRQRRCLIVVDGFFEWQKQGKHKQPYHIWLKDDGPFAFAGLWERWQEPGGEPVESFTIVTTEANGLMKPLHDRMPVILAPWDYDRWIDPQSREVDELQALLVPCPDEWLTATPVSTYVNSPKNEGPKCLEPVQV